MYIALLCSHGLMSKRRQPIYAAPAPTRGQKAFLTRDGTAIVQLCVVVGGVVGLKSFACARAGSRTAQVEHAHIT